ncbi:MAG: integration host factor subunit alpha [Nitrospinae bacterium]|nr:integration host factor subunit alpha [Nitrospinota bacterium]
MVKTSIVDYIYEKIGHPRKLAAISVEEIINSIKETLANGENIQIVGFGRFNLRKKNERTGRDPATGEEITISARQVLTFKPSRQLKDAVLRRVRNKNKFRCNNNIKP